MTVDTFKARRRQDMGNGNFREYGELIPEAHTWFTMESYLHTGEIEDAFGVEETEFRAAVAKYCPDLSDQVLAAVGLQAPRERAMIPEVVHENMHPGSHRDLPPLLGVAPQHGTVAEAGSTTIVPTDIRPGTPTPVLRPGVDRKDADMGAYDSAGDHPDPAALNELLSATSPEQLKEDAKTLKDLKTGTGDGVDLPPAPNLTPAADGNGEVPSPKEAQAASDAEAKKVTKQREAAEATPDAKKATPAKKAAPAKASSTTASSAAPAKASPPAAKK